MKISVKCFATMAEAHQCDYRQASPHELPNGATVKDLAKVLGIAPEEVKLVFVNGKGAELDTVLKEGDQVGLAPATGGM
ncbi:MAG: MoaD/ThiS family protein [Deltaproteobacteria bacterium]|nr:MoaD/ThiS family protein [Deltaproteobacteria bacterium]